MLLLEEEKLKSRIETIIAPKVFGFLKKYRETWSNAQFIGIGILSIAPWEWVYQKNSELMRYLSMDYARAIWRGIPCRESNASSATVQEMPHEPKVTDNNFQNHDL